MAKITLKITLFISEMNKVDIWRMWVNPRPFTAINLNKFMTVTQNILNLSILYKHIFHNNQAAYLFLMSKTTK